MATAPTINTGTADNAGDGENNRSAWNKQVAFNAEVQGELPIRANDLASLPSAVGLPDHTAGSVISPAPANYKVVSGTWVEV